MCSKVIPNRKSDQTKLLNIPTQPNKATKKSHILTPNYTENLNYYNYLSKIKDFHKKKTNLIVHSIRQIALTPNSN